MITPFHRLQLEMAERECVSGTLSEWPALRQALAAHELDLPLETSARALRAVCKLLLCADALFDVDHMLQYTPLAELHPWVEELPSESTGRA